MKEKPEEEKVIEAIENNNDYKKLKGLEKYTNKQIKMFFATKAIVKKKDGTYEVDFTKVSKK